MDSFPFGPKKCKHSKTKAVLHVLAVVVESGYFVLPLLVLFDHVGEDLEVHGVEVFGPDGGVHPAKDDVHEPVVVGDLSPAVQGWVDEDLRLLRKRRRIRPIGNPRTSKGVFH